MFTHLAAFALAYNIDAIFKYMQPRHKRGDLKLAVLAALVDGRWQYPRQIASPNRHLPFTCH